MLNSMWEVLLALSPWLLLGMAIAGLLHVVLPDGFVRRQLTGRYAVLKAVLLGVPLPLCSCGVIPTGLGPKKDGASNGAAIGFLISTPQTGVDSVLVSSAFLGWPFAIFKVVAAALTGLVGGTLADLTADSSSDAAPEAASPGSRRRGVRDAIDHSLGILRSIWGWVVLGVVASAAIEVLVPGEFFAGLSNRGPVVPVLAALLISLPLYVCATASVPIAAALVAGGMPTGAALVFLMAGPATNVATIGAIYRTLGKRALAIYLGTIVVGSVGAGLLFDSLLATGATAPGHAHGEATWWAVAGAVVLLALMGWFALGDLRRLAGRLRAAGETTLELRVAGMTCGGCTSKLERALSREDGVEGVDVSLEREMAVIRGAIDERRIRLAVERAGFTVVDA